MLTQTRPKHHIPLQLNIRLLHAQSSQCLILSFVPAVLGTASSLHFTLSLVYKKKKIIGAVQRLLACQNCLVSMRLAHNTSVSPTTVTLENNSFPGFTIACTNLFHVNRFPVAETCSQYYFYESVISLVYYNVVHTCFTVLVMKECSYISVVIVHHYIRAVMYS